MKEIQVLFLQALQAALKNENVSWEEQLDSQTWLDLFRLADKHQVMPMIFEAIYQCQAATSLEPYYMVLLKQQTVRVVSRQTLKTSEFLQLFSYLRSGGVQPLVVKGIVCRSLYPKPDDRPSGDEDILVPEEQFAQCHRAMLEYGMQLLDPAQDIDSSHEVSYVKRGSLLHIELHRSLFPPQEAAYGDFNRFFKNAHNWAVRLDIDGNCVETMGYTDHLFYMISHAFKHFLHSGFGIRQVCDIILFANAFGREIDWNQMLLQCREIQAHLFAAALFQIGEKYLTFDAETACYPQEWRSIQVDERMLLEDLLDAGVYGGSSLSRKHSSNMTLGAFAAQKEGKKVKSGSLALKTAFPSAKALQGRYPWLRKKTWLLPVAWLLRIVKYRRETAESDNNRMADSLRIGNERVELLRQYGIIGGLDVCLKE